MRLGENALPKKREQQREKHGELLRRAHIPLRPTCGKSLIGSVERRDASQTEPVSVQGAVQRI